MAAAVNIGVWTMESFSVAMDGKITEGDNLSFEPGVYFSCPCGWEQPIPNDAQVVFCNKCHRKLGEVINKK